MKLLKWSPDRLAKNLAEFALIGADERGGITRLSFSQEYGRAAELYSQKLQEAGLQVHVDVVGNVVGIKKGKRSDDIMMTGSHLDTVVQGGQYDGALGVLAALEYAHALKDSGIELDNTLQIVGFAAEEGGPFGGTFGSRAMMGLIDLSDPNLESSLSSIGLHPTELRSVAIQTDNIKAFLELHIEQGDRLITSGIPIGIVTGIVGITRYEITITGESNHSGTTTMDNRRDAVDGFAQLVKEANRIICSTPHMVGTFGVVNVHPNMANIIPGKVETVLELRHMEREAIEDVFTQIEKAAGEIQTAEFGFRTSVDKKSCSCSEGIIRSIQESCSKKDIQALLMASGAGHDANAIANRIPVGMIFVPSLGGKSHCPEEETLWEDMVTGCEVYFQSLRELDRRITVRAI